MSKLIILKHVPQSGIEQSYQLQSQSGQQLRIKIGPKAKFQLIDQEKQDGPDQIRLRRRGNDLEVDIEVDGDLQPDLVLEGYYDEKNAGAMLMGESDVGTVVEYSPVNEQADGPVQALTALQGGLYNLPYAAGGWLGAGLVAAAGAVVVGVVSSGGSSDDGNGNGNGNGDNTAPVLTLSPPAIPVENSATDGQVITTATVVDPDGPPPTFRLAPGSDPNGYYRIDPTTGTVSLTGPGAEHVNNGGNLPPVVVEVDDGRGGTDTETITIPETQDANDAPELSLSAPPTPAQGSAAAGQVVTRASATDEENDPITYALAGSSASNGFYNIDPTTGVVTLTAAGAALVNAGRDLPPVEVTANDGKGGTDTESVPVPPTTDTATPPAPPPAPPSDTNRPPVLSLSAPPTLRENTATEGQQITRASATDADGNQLTYSLATGSNPNGYYAINPANGVVSLTAAGAALVNSGGDLPPVRVTVSDGRGGSDTESVNVPTTQDVNDAPVLSLTMPSAPQKDSAAANDVVTRASATDEEGNPVTFSLKPNSDPNGFYAINPTTGVVTLTPAGAAFVRGGGDLPPVVVVASDGNLTDTESVTVPKTSEGVNTPPSLSLSQPVPPVDGDAVAGNLITVATSEDAEGDPITFSLAPGSDPNGHYQIDPNTGEVTLTAAGAVHVNNGGNLPPVRVTAADEQGGEATAQIAVPATRPQDVNNPPVLTLSAPVAPEENEAAAGDLITTASATDADNNPVTFSLAEGSDPNGYYAINPTTGKVTLTAPGAAHVNAGGDLPLVVVVARDNQGGTDKEAASVPDTVQVNDAPTLSLTQPVPPVQGEAAAGDVITTATAEDEEGDPITLGLANDANGDNISDDGFYQINPTTGAVTLTPAGAAHVNAGNDLPPVQVTAQDDQGGETEAQVDVPGTQDGNGGVNNPPVTVPGQGEITIAANGDYSFTPVAGFVGVLPTMSYTVTDGRGSSTVSALTLQVMPLPPAPPAPPEAPQSESAPSGSDYRVCVGDNSFQPSAPTPAFQPSLHVTHSVQQSGMVSQLIGMGLSSAEAEMLAELIVQSGADQSAADNAVARAIRGLPVGESLSLFVQQSVRTSQQQAAVMDAWINSQLRASLGLGSEDPFALDNPLMVQFREQARQVSERVTERADEALAQAVMPTGFEVRSKSATDSVADVVSADMQAAVAQLLLDTQASAEALISNPPSHKEPTHMPPKTFRQQLLGLSESSHRPLRRA